MAEIKYKISGKSDTTAIAKTQLAMKKLGSEVANINKIIGGFAIAKVMQVVSKVTNGATENFLAQNKALAQYNATVTKFGKSLSNLNKIQNAVSRNNFFDGDSINNVTKMAVAMGLTENQIEDVLKASTDLAASGVMPLDQAVKELSLSYSGNLEQLKKMNPELAKLTKAQLEQGKAVKIIGKQYEGMADAMANTFEGRDTQWKNSFSDLQAAFGGIIQAAKFGFQGRMMDSLNKITEWIIENKESIIKFLYGLPDIIAAIGKSGFEIIKRTFTGEGMVNLLTFLGKGLFITLYVTAFSLYRIFQALILDIYDFFDFIIGNLWRKLQDLLGKLGNLIITTINIAFQKVLSIPGIKQLYEWLSGNKIGDAQIIDFRFDTNHADKNLSNKDVASKWIENWNEAMDSYKKDVSKALSAGTKTLDKFVDDYSDVTSEAKEQIKEILAKDLPDDMKEAMIAGIITADKSKGNKDNNDYDNKDNKKKLSDLISIVGNAFIKSTGQIGNYVNAAMQGASSGGAYGAALSVIAQLLSDIMQVVSENSEKFQVFQNFVTLILESLIEQIIPIFDEFVTPFLESFSAVKEILSGVVYLLGSIIGVFTEIFKEFTKNLNIITPIVSGIFKIFGSSFQMIRGFIQFMQPIMNALSYITKIIATAIYTVEWVIANGINMIIRALNQIPWVNISEISGFDDYGKVVDDIWNGGENTEEDNAYLNAAISQSASNITGSSASYTAARDIYVNISYDHSYVNGDSREIALNLYNELKDCKKLNLIA